MAYIPSYVTLDYLKSLSFDTQKATDDAVLKRFCLEASRTVEVLALGRKFAPYYETVYFDLPQPDNGLLKMQGRDLLEIDTFTTENDGVTLSASDYVLRSGERYETPYDIVEMVSNGSYPYLLYSGTPQKSQKIIGWWGMVPHYSDAWEATASTLTSISGTTLTIDGDVDELTVIGDAYEYPVLSILKIDDELMLVGSRNEANNTLTVKRGINGTTSASHAAASTIYRFVPDDMIARVARRIAAWYYRRRSQSRDADRPVITAHGIMLPSGFPKEIEATMASFRYAGFY